MLGESEWNTIALASPRRVYNDSNLFEDGRKVFARPISNLNFMVQKATLYGHASLIDTLLEFGNEKCVLLESLVGFPAVRAAL